MRFSAYDAAIKSVPNCGKLIMKDGSKKLLPFREVVCGMRYVGELIGATSQPLDLRTVVLGSAPR
jgi:hypothetical protein